jgi:hypothetical protein
VLPDWSQPTAIAELDVLLAEATEMTDEQPGSERLTAWGFRVTDFLTEVFGQGSAYFTGWRSIRWRVNSAEPEFEHRQRAAVERAIGTSRGILIAARLKLEGSPDIAAVHSAQDTPPEASFLITAINLAERRLRKVMRTPPRDERTLHDEFEKLLIGARVPYARGSRQIEYESRIYVPDFTLDRARLAVDLKVCLDERHASALPGEITDDIAAYRREYPNMLFIVYDTWYIRDIDRFRGHFDDEIGVIVVVIEH